MKYKLLGKTGIRVSELCLGTMTFGTDWGSGADKETSKKIYDEFVNKGGNFFDTANVYTKGSSEKYLGEFCHSERNNVVIASKYSLSEADKINSAGNHRKNMMQSIDASLKQLNTDFIDLYYVHAWDFTVHPEELMRNLEYLVQSGKVLSIGISDTPAWIASQCNTIANMRGWTPFAAYQVEYCLTEHTADREIIPLTKGQDMAFCGFGPLAAGLLSGKYIIDNNEPKRMNFNTSPRLNEANLELCRQLIAISNEWGITPGQAALRWAMQRTDNSVPIFGARSHKHVLESLEVLNFQLDEKQMETLNTLSKIGGHFPNEFLSSARLQYTLYGNHRADLQF